MTTALQAIAYKAQTHPKHVFQNLSTLLDEGLLFESWGQLKKNVAPGIDGVNAEAYSQELSTRITALVDKLKRGEPPRVSRRLFSLSQAAIAS